MNHTTRIVVVDPICAAERLVVLAAMMVPVLINAAMPGFSGAVT